MPHADVAPIERRIVITNVDGRLRCTFDDRVAVSSDVQWTLHRGDYNPRRASEPVQGGATWEVNLPDITNGFAVRAVVDGVTYDSNWVQHYSAEAVRKYSQWRTEWNSQSHDAPHAVGLFRYEEPFDSIALVCHRGNVSLEGLQGFAAEQRLTVEMHNGVFWQEMAVMSGGASRTDKAGNHYLFSGVTRDEERLLFGAADVAEYVDDVTRLRGEVGEFHLLSWNDEGISFTHDYIGQGHIFFYEHEGVLVAANGLHLLVRVMRSIGLTVELDLRVAKGKFFATSYPFEAHHGAASDILGVRRLSVYEDLDVRPAGLEITKSELWRDNRDGDYSEQMYEELLGQAAEDIIDNVRIALAHPRFEDVIVEISAGLDTRIIYCALTNLPVSDKVRVATRRGTEESTAAAINNLYGFPWDDLSKTYSYLDSDSSLGLPESSHSVFMDGYYIESMFKARQEYARPTLVLTGHGGEAFSRVMSTEGYFARDYAGELPEVPGDIDDVLANVIRYVGNHQVWLAAGDLYFADTLRACIDESPSEVFQKRFTDLYVSERNPFVGGSVFRGAMTGPQWRPLQSKALYRLKAQWFRFQQDFRLQYDLIRVLNPLISEVPYLKEVERARKDEFHQYRKPFGLQAPIQFDDGVDAVRKARRVSEQRSHWVPDREEFDATTQRVRAYEDDPQSFLYPLGVILALSPDFDDMGLPLFTYIDRMANRDNPRAFSKRHNVRNKLHILMQEVLLTTDGAARLRANALTSH